jgi:beta-ureidopropionase
MKIALLQATASLEKEENVQKTLKYVEKAAAQGVDIICFQELFSTIYFPYHQDHKYFKWAETIPGPTVNRMMEAAQKNNINIICPIFEIDTEVPGIFYNTAVLIDRKGKMLGKYRKTHIPQLVGYLEKMYFRPGNLGYPVFEVDGHKIGIYICYDRHYPEGPRTMALKGAELVFIPTCTAIYPELWELELRAHASFNTMFVAGVNRCGVECDVQPGPYFGTATVANPLGKVVARATNEEQLLVADIDFNEVIERRVVAPFLRDRRPELYDYLTKFT